MSTPYNPDEGPGKYICRHCGSDRLTFSGNGTWNQEKQVMEFEEGDDKPYCQQCDDTTTWAKFVPLGHDERAAPRIDTDYYDNAYIVIDDEGEPVGDFHVSVHDAREFREEQGDEAKQHRIVKVGVKILPDYPEIVDDPRTGLEATD